MSADDFMMDVFNEIVSERCKDLLGFHSFQFWKNNEVGGLYIFYRTFLKYR